MAQDSDEERTEEATPRRIQKAREEGQVPRSRELSTFAVTMTGTALLIATGGHIYRQFNRVLERAFTFDQKTLADQSLIGNQLRESLFDMLLALAPLLAALFIAAAVVPLLVGGWNVADNAFEPKFSKLNPISGFKRMFSVMSLVEAAKAVLKSFLIGGIATWVIWHERDQLIGLITLPLDRSIKSVFEMTEHTFLIVVSAMVLLVVIDVPWQIYQYNKNLRMSKQEIKEEMKQSEGSPEVKGRIRQMQRAAARRRMMRDVPNASVVVTNPTHYAVAIQYEDGMPAPRIVAKGTLRLAEKIVGAAKEHRVTIMRAPPFARALYHNTEIGDEIPAALYSAAAQVLAYVFQLKQYETAGGVAPVYPDQLPVPAELDPETKQSKPASGPDTARNDA